MNKVNYNREMVNIIENLSEKKSLLLHSCCGPCSTAVLKRLTDRFDISIYFYNPNIYPESEFYKRAETQKDVIAKMGGSIELIVGSYEEDKYFESVKGLEDLGEGSLRCKNCYEFRLREAARYAKAHNFDYFTTTLSVSPYKNATWINEIGRELEEEVGIKFLYADFKKKEGYKESIVLSKKYNLYRQDYCGCKFSKDEALK